MLKSPRLWLAALLLAVAIHLDWHLGRPGHHADLSFALPYHWLLALPVFAGLQAFVQRRWPSESTMALGLSVLLGVLLGQGVEPLLELLSSPGDPSPFRNAERWRVFLEFMLAGIATLVMVAVLNLRRRSARRQQPR